MKRIDSGALEPAVRALGLTGAGAAITELEDGRVEQSLEMGQIARRGGTFASTGGIFQGRLQNDHQGADTLFTSVAPYAIAAGVVAPYPSPMPPGFDIWLLDAAVRQTGGAGTIAAVLLVQELVQGFSIDNLGAGAGGILSSPVAFWDTIVSVTTTFATQVNGGPLAMPGIRLARSAQTLLTFRSTSSAAAAFDCVVRLGVFPAPLGQDGIV